MRPYNLEHLSDGALLEKLCALVAQDRVTTAEILAHIAEVDVRKLYLGAGYDSMHSYCVGALRLSDDAAFNRIQAARVARRFPAIFDAVAEGRLHLTAVRLLAPHLTAENAPQLLVAGEHKRKYEIEQLLAERFLPPELPIAVQSIRPVATPPVIRPIPNHSIAPTAAPIPTKSNDKLVPERVEGQVEEQEEAQAEEQLEAQDGRESETQGYSLLQLTIPNSTLDQLRYAQQLLSHSIPDGDLAKVLDRAVRTLVTELEKEKFAATEKPRSKPDRLPKGRRIPAAVKRAVWKRDQGRCTFVAQNGHRCEARKFLEFDHVVPVARGGQATLELIRLRCRAHNQLEAERIFGAGFMAMKRGKRLSADACDGSSRSRRARTRPGSPGRSSTRARAPSG